jgi:hypothetical protein
LKNDVRFITFNYDVSLEQALYQGLRHIQLFDAADIDEFLANDRIMHVYGKVRERPTEPAPALNWSEQGRDPKGLGLSALIQYYSERKVFLDHIYAASRGLRVIDPEDKETDKEIIKAATKAAAEAKRVYILGYGLDPNNSERIGLPKSLHYGTSKKSVMFTNYGDINRVNKRASKVFFGAQNQFNPGGHSIVAQRDALYERSIRDVYEALELDFEPFE